MGKSEEVHESQEEILKRAVQLKAGPALSIGDASKYLRITYSGLQRRLMRQEFSHIHTYGKGINNKRVYILVKDLEEMDGEYIIERKKP